MSRGVDAYIDYSLFTLGIFIVSYTACSQIQICDASNRERPTREWGVDCVSGCNATIEVFRILGLLGVLGSFTIMITDWVGFTRPMSAAHERIDTSTVEHRFRAFHAVTGVGVPRWRTYWASIIGGLAMLPCGLGFATVYLALSPAGQIEALIVSGLLGGIMVFGVLSHTLFGVFADLNIAREATDPGSPARKAADLFYARLLDYWLWFTLPILAMQAAGSLWFSYLVFTDQTALPVWMGLLNHFLLSQLFMNTRYYLPFAFARWLGPPHMHLPTTLPLLVLATLYIWNGV